jgi:hypothetical protein
MGRLCEGFEGILIFFIKITKARLSCVFTFLLRAVCVKYRTITNDISDHVGLSTPLASSVTESGVSGHVTKKNTTPEL